MKVQTFVSYFFIVNSIVLKLSASTYEFNQAREKFQAAKAMSIEEMRTYTKRMLYCVSYHEDGESSSSYTVLKLSKKNDKKWLHLDNDSIGVEVRLLEGEFVTVYPEKSLRPVPFYDTYRLLDNSVIIETSHVPYTYSTLLGRFKFGEKSKPSIVFPKLISRNYKVCN